MRSKRQKLIASSIAIIGMFIPLFSAVPSKQIIALYDGPAPGSEAWDWNETKSKLGNMELVYNVSTPTLTVYPANKSKATGRAIVVCPGGAFLFLSHIFEGENIAEWLSEEGIVVFLLKYRVDHLETPNIGKEWVDRRVGTPEFHTRIQPIVKMAIEDGRNAVAYVRNHAEKWNVDPEKIGIMGFSAGGTVASGVAWTYDEQSRPDFVAPIYPHLSDYSKDPVPSDAPPLFIAVASDDHFGFQNASIKMYQSWNQIGKSAELHIYSKGGHGFAGKTMDLPVDFWTDSFMEWVRDL